MLELSGTRAIVTGGSSGIGRALCIRLGNLGCNVTNISKFPTDKEGGPNVDEFLNIKTLCLDVRDLENLKSAVKQIRPNVLINNAGVLTLDDFLEQNIDDYQYVMGINLMAPIFAVQALLEVSAGLPWVSIINIASTSGLKADPDTPIYGASKAGLINFTESIAAQYGPKVRCNCICPGFIDTQLVSVEEGAGIPQAEIDKVPMKRIGTPDEVVGIVIPVITNEYINGASIVIDGGRSHGVWKWGI